MSIVKHTQDMEEFEITSKQDRMKVLSGKFLMCVMLVYICDMMYAIAKHNIYTIMLWDIIIFAIVCHIVMLYLICNTHLLHAHIISCTNIIYR